MEKNLQVSLLLDFYGELLSEKQRDILDDYYNSDLSLSEIAEDKAMTRQGVRDHVKRSEVQLFEMEEKLGLHKHFINVNKKLLQITALSEEICANKNIFENAKEIKKIAEDLR
ncbi:MAG: sigma factor-like helix-turn-helix DNA-binding protein [Clostridia bacterium]